MRWAAKYGFKFPFQRVDGVMLSDVWHRAIENVDVATAAVDAYLADRRWEGESHPSTKFKQHALTYIKRAHQAGAGVGYGPIKLDNTKPGEFASDLPLGVRTYAGEGGGASAAG